MRCKKLDVNGYFRTRLAGLSILDRISIRHLNFAWSGDTLIVWRLDRLSRSLRDLLETVALLESRGVQLKSLHESIDTASSSGKLIFHLFGALAEFERSPIKVRTLAGLQTARARGRKGGLPTICQQRLRNCNPATKFQLNTLQRVCRFRFKISQKCRSKIPTFRTAGVQPTPTTLRIYFETVKFRDHGLINKVGKQSKYYSAKLRRGGCN